MQDRSPTSKMGKDEASSPWSPDPAVLESLPAVREQVAEYYEQLMALIDELQAAEGGVSSEELRSKLDEVRSKAIRLLLFGKRQSYMENKESSEDDLPAIDGATLRESLRKKIRDDDPVGCAAMQLADQLISLADGNPGAAKDFDSLIGQLVCVVAAGRTKVGAILQAAGGSRETVGLSYVAQVEQECLALQQENRELRMKLNAAKEQETRMATLFRGAESTPEGRLAHGRVTYRPMD